MTIAWKWLQQNMNIKSDIDSTAAADLLNDTSLQFRFQ